MLQRQTLSLNFWSYSPVDVCCCGTKYLLFHFRSYSRGDVRRFDNIYFIFGHIHHVEARRCQVFGHVHKIRSYSFGHLGSVMLVFLFQRMNFITNIYFHNKNFLFVTIYSIHYQMCIVLHIYLSNNVIHHQINNTFNKHHFPSSIVYSLFIWESMVLD